MFGFEMILVIILLIEGLSMGVLMAFHYVNFKNGSLLKEDEQEGSTYASIMPNEYHRFDTDEVDAHSMDENSSYEV